MGLAAVAMNYIGHPYLLGGAPGVDGTKPWDCSSAIAWWGGHDMGMRLPGQSKAGYNGTSHGPGSWQYITWAGATTIQGPPAADDLVIWPGMGPAGHIGVAIDAANMISALNPVDGTKVTPIASTKPGIHIYRRLNGQAVNTNPGCPIPGLMIALIGWETLHGVGISLLLPHRQSKRRDTHGRSQILPDHIRPGGPSLGRRRNRPRA